LIDQSDNLCYLVIVRALMRRAEPSRPRASLQPRRLPWTVSRQHLIARTRAQDYDAKRLDLAQFGYSGTSIARIASACGVSKALLYHHYSDGVVRTAVRCKNGMWASYCAPTPMPKRNG